ncbi:MAG: CPXCG motif-containing cysteine-rich protein [Gemmatimonadetes bacterium]|nr:CPXCG motif-containing cysteine-rich protein [Gemmatimonadota bacterium]
MGPIESSEVICPYCGETIEHLLDPGGGEIQEYVEDCEVCCRPWSVRVRYDPETGLDVRVERADE